MCIIIDTHFICKTTVESNKLYTYCLLNIDISFSSIGSKLFNLTWCFRKKFSL